MSNQESMAALASAALSRAAFNPATVPELAGNAFFGDEGTGAVYIPDFSEALAAAGSDEDRTSRILTAIKAVDDSANIAPSGIFARAKKEIPDLAKGELAFLVSYLKATRDIDADPNEKERVVHEIHYVPPPSRTGQAGAGPAEPNRPAAEPRREARPQRTDGARRDERDDRPQRGDDRNARRGGRPGEEAQVQKHPCEVEFHIRIGGKDSEEVSRLTADLYELFQRKTVTVEVPAPIAAQPAPPEKSPDDIAFEALLPEIEALFTAKADGDAAATSALFALHERFPEGSALRDKVDSYVNARIVNPGAMHSPAFQRRYGVQPPAPSSPGP